MDEPTVAEMIRSLQATLDRQAQAQETFVTKEMMDLRFQLQERDDAEQNRRIQVLEDRESSRTRTFWTSLAAPVIVGVVLAVILGVVKP